MIRKIVWLMGNCLIMAALLLASCAPAVTEEEETVVLPGEEQWVIAEEATSQEEAVMEEESTLPAGEEVAATIDSIRFQPESIGQTAVGVMSWRNTGDVAHDFNVIFYLISPEEARQGPVQVEEDVHVAPQVTETTGVRLNFEGLSAGTYGVSADVRDAETEELVASRNFPAILILTLEAREVVVEEASSTPAAFSVTDLSIEPPEVMPNETVTIAVSIANTGGSDGNYNVVLMINGVKEVEKSIPIAAGGSQTVRFAGAKQNAGSYSVAVGELSGSFTVLAATVGSIPVQPAVPSGVKVTLDAGRSNSSPVSSESAVLSVTASDGTGLTLTVPASALLSQNTITLTPISDIQGVPIQGTFIGGVHMVPDGLQFSKPCTLEIELPANIGAVRLVSAIFPAEGVGELKPVEVRGAKAILLIDHFSTAAVFTSEESLVSVLVSCKENTEGQILERNEYFESPIIQHRIRSRVDEEGNEYETFEFLETTGDPQGSHGKIWTYIDEDGREYTRIRQYNSDGSLSFSLDQIDGQDVNPSELDSIFTADFATRGAPPEPNKVATALKRLREKMCGEEKEFECAAVASVSVSPNHWELEVGEHILLEPEVRDANGNLLKGYDVCWGSSDENVASVDEFGIVTGVGGGLANVGTKVCGEWGLALIEVLRLEGTWVGSWDYGIYLMSHTILKNEVEVVITKVGEYEYDLELTGQLKRSMELEQGERIYDYNMYGKTRISLTPGQSRPWLPFDLIPDKREVGTIEMCVTDARGSGLQTSPLYIDQLSWVSAVGIGGCVEWTEGQNPSVRYYVDVAVGRVGY